MLCLLRSTVEHKKCNNYHKNLITLIKNIQCISDKKWQDSRRVLGEIREKPSSTVALSGHFISMKIVGAVLGGGLMTLCLLRPGTAQYIIFAVVDFVVIFNLCIKKHFESRLRSFK